MPFNTTDWTVFWTAVGSVAASLAVLLPLFIWLGRRIFSIFSTELRNFKKENEELKQQIDTTLRMPTFALDTVHLTEKAAQYQIQELQRNYEQALKARDQEQVSLLSDRLEQIRKLQSELEQLSLEQQQLENRLANAFSGRGGEYYGHAVRVPTGFILVVREGNLYGAVQPIDQSGPPESAIKFVWWYQSDSTANFTAPSAQFGFGETSEANQGSCWLQIGKIRLEWSAGGNGFGYIYFGSTSGSNTIELALSREVDIRRLRVNELKFLKSQNGQN